MDPQLQSLMAYVSETRPGMTRGPHEHLEQTDYFCFLGPSTFKVNLWDNRTDSPTYWNKQTIVAGEKNPCALNVPNRVVHADRNLGRPWFR